MSTTAPSVGLHGDAVHEYIEAATLANHSSEDLLHFSFHGVIDAKRDGGTTGGTHHLVGLVYGFITIVRRAGSTSPSCTSLKPLTPLSQRSRTASPRPAPCP